MIELKYDEDLTASANKNRLVLFQFGSETCMPCHAVRSKIDLWHEKHPDVLIRYISVDDHPALAAQNGVFSLPCVLVLLDGHEIIRESGFFSLEEILSKTEWYLDMIKEQG